MISDNLKYFNSFFNKITNPSQIISTNINKINLQIITKTYIQITTLIYIQIIFTNNNKN